MKKLNVFSVVIIALLTMTSCVNLPNYLTLNKGDVKVAVKVKEKPEARRCHVTIPPDPEAMVKLNAEAREETLIAFSESLLDDLRACQMKP